MLIIDEYWSYFSDIMMAKKRNLSGLSAAVKTMVIQQKILVRLKEVLMKII